MFPLQAFGMTNDKYAGEGPASFRSRFPCLGGVGAAGFQIVEHRKAGDIGYPRAMKSDWL